MVAKQFSIDELEKMLSDHIEYHLGMPDEANAQDGNVLFKNTVNIAKQLLTTIKSGVNTEGKPDHVTAEELETMIANYETYWNDRSGRGDIEAENADVLPGRIIWITKQLIETMKS